MSVTRLAIAQVNPIMGNFDYNVNLIKTSINQACQQGCDLIIFPELVVCGYPPEDLLLRQSFLMDVEQALAKVKSATRDIAAIVGYPFKAAGLLYNAAGLFYDDQLLDKHYKIELPNYGVFDEKRYFSQGKEPLVFEFNELRFGLTICEDIWINDGICSQYFSKKKPDYIINLAASPYHIKKMQERQTILARFAKKVDAGIIYANLLGGQDELVFDGGSMVVDHQGRVVATAEHFETDLMIFDITPKASNVSNDGRYDLVIESKSLFNKTADPVRSKAGLKDGIDEIYHALVLGTKDYLRKNNFKKALIGMSGGIDSAVTAAIAKEAIGAENVLAISMPSDYSSAGTKADAQLCSERLGVAFQEVPIKEVFSSYQLALKELLADEQPGLEMENIQARIRGNYLMALSNKYGYLVLTTGNKSETAVGYCTLYGDMAGGFAVIKDVYKTTIYELAHHVNRRAGRELIPQSIIERAPSAELRADQKDEDSLPPYDVLDPILKAYIEDGRSPDEIIQLGFEKNVVLETIRMVDRNEYKRRQAPPGIKITPRAFGRDWRLPISNHYSAHLLKQYS